MVQVMVRRTPLSAVSACCAIRTWAYDGRTRVRLGVFLSCRPGRCWTLRPTHPWISLELFGNDLKII